MPEVLDVETETSSDLSQSERKLHPFQDENHLFKKGNPGGPGRPKGSLSYARALSRASNKLAAAYVKHALKGSAPLLIDSRKVFLPIDDDRTHPSGDRVVIFIGEGSLPRPCAQVPMSDNIHTDKLLPESQNSEQDVSQSPHDAPG